MEYKDITEYIQKLIEVQVNQDKDDFDNVLYDGNSKQASWKDVGLVVTNLISNINSQMMSLEDDVINNFNVLIQSMLDSEIIDQQTVDNMQKYIQENKQKVEE